MPEKESGVQSPECGGTGGENRRINRKEHKELKDPEWDWEP
jgi:hypothetical protein